MPHSHPFLIAPNPSSLYLSKFSLVFLLYFPDTSISSSNLNTPPAISLLARRNHCNLFCLNLSSCIIFKPRLFVTSSLEILSCHLTLAMYLKILLLLYLISQHSSIAVSHISTFFYRCISQYSFIAVSQHSCIAVSQHSSIAT